MKRHRRFQIATTVVALLAAFVLVARSRAAEPMPEIGPLAEYVAQPDASYGWTKLHEGAIGGTDYCELRLTSQTWKDIVWKHQLFVIRPKSVKADSHHALLFIAGGRWRDEYDQANGPTRLPREATLFATLAEQIGTPIAVLLQVPHQPILGDRYEDQAIAYTFAQYLKTGDEQWPLLLPMVKSAVRGMDAISDFAAEQWKLDVKTFTVTGASKRGWTTWLTGAVDPRATAIAPMVIDMLNMATQMDHQKKTFGQFSEQIDDYTRLGLQDRLKTPAGKSLQAIVDPFSYRERLSQPKLILLGTNDAYWPLDAANLYWDQLKGPKYLLYVPNNGHGLNDYARIAGSLNALHQHTARGKRLPQMKWDFQEEAGKLQLQVNSDIAPDQVRAWMAKSPTRDFRKATWYSLDCRRDGETFTHQLETPTDGYAALFGEAVFSRDEPLAYFLSTNVRIIGGEATGE
ncbi:MAG: hypothetical protein KDA62_12730 [Planctomycetales bacterium]|nr:hypothetical protein [Planctomycetales bacterium]